LHIGDINSEQHKTLGMYIIHFNERRD